MASLPVVKRGIIGALKEECRRKGRGDFLKEIYTSMAQHNPYLAGYLAGELDGRAGGYLETPSPDEYIDRIVQDNSEQGKIRLAAFVTTCLLYKLLESQAEADEMEKTIKL